MIRFLLDVYIFIIIIDVVLSYLPQFKHTQWASFIKLCSDFSCKPIRKFLPADLPFDFSPLIVILIINLIKSLW